MTKLAAKLPDGDSNGLQAISSALIDSPNSVHVVVMLVDCKSTTTDNDTGDVTPTARIRRIEPIDEDKAIVGRILRRAMEQRTGKTVLPWAAEEDMRAVFGDLNIDMETGEIKDSD